MLQGDLGYTPDELVAQATNPKQYDVTSTGWDGQGVSAETTARVAHYVHYVEPFTSAWAGRDVLDVGAGAGWLVDHALQQGARSAVGIEPAASNVAAGRLAYPRARLIEATLETYQPEPGQQFDSVASIMAVGHMGDIDEAFNRFREFLRPTDPEVLLVVPDYEYFTRQRNGYRDVVVFPRGEGEVVQASVKQDGSALADIIRTPMRYQRAAEKVGLQVTHQVPMPPTEGYMAAVPRYRQNRGVSMTQLMRFGT